MASMQTLEDLLHEQLQDLYDAEGQIIKALPKMAEAASSTALRNAFESHLKQTYVHRERLEKIFTDLGQKPQAKTCKAMQGLIKEGEEMVKENADPTVKDAGLIAAAQRVEHYEMAGYGCVRTWANLLDMKSVADVLQKTLDEEGETDKKLTSLAERVVNVKAANA